MVIQLDYGESFIATFNFSYRGAAMPIGLKVALGRIYVAFFDEVESWILQKSLPYTASWKSYTMEARCTIPLKGSTDLKPGEDYDASAEIGDYPWTGHVYIMKREKDIVRIISEEEPPPSEFTNLSVSYKKA